jgi:hypothetical protein
VPTLADRLRQRRQARQINTPGSGGGVRATLPIPEDAVAVVDGGLA